MEFYSGWRVPLGGGGVMFLSQVRSSLAAPGVSVLRVSSWPGTLIRFDGLPVYQAQNAAAATRAVQQYK